MLYKNKNCLSATRHLIYLECSGKCEKFENIITQVTKAKFEDYNKYFLFTEIRKKKKKKKEKKEKKKFAT